MLSNDAVEKPHSEHTVQRWAGFFQTKKSMGSDSEDPRIYFDSQNLASVAPALTSDLARPYAHAPSRLATQSAAGAQWLALRKSLWVPALHPSGSLHRQERRGCIAWNPRLCWL